MDKAVNLFSNTFDVIHTFWEKERTHQFVSVLLIVIFILSLGVIEINRQGWLPVNFSSLISTSHYFAINLAFSLVLILEVISLIFALPSSMSKALGKQFEILALIFLRSSFKELSKLPEPIDIRINNKIKGGSVYFFILNIFYAMVKGLTKIQLFGSIN